jgi:HAD superfamily 5'-nucleotidase-like hydrolase
MLTQLKIEKNQRIFVNRSLNFGDIKLVGFDMDYTLALYKRATFEELAFAETLKKFIAAGYPEELADLKFKHDFVIRGLLVDRERGNVLKVDGHKYVKDAYHGYRRLSKEERYVLYNQQSFPAQDYLSIDSLFALSEVQLFVEIVDYMNRHPGKIAKSFQEVYEDIRYYIDLSHKDHSIKAKVLADPSRYLHKDKYLASSLIRQIDAGKALFILTNSNAHYTHEIMSWVFEGANQGFSSWRDYWRYVITDAGKPGFFSGDQPFYTVDENNNATTTTAETLSFGGIYRGGNAKLFESLTSYRGDEILYVGDHIYGDIIQSKGTLNWRTMLVVEELEEELPKLAALRPRLDRIYQKINERELLDEKLQRLRSKIGANTRQIEKARARHDAQKAEALEEDNRQLNVKFFEMIQALKNLEETIKALIDQRAKKVHPVWGELMKVGLETSRFAHQVNDYACLYTSRVSNLRYYSPYKKFISFHEILPIDE